MRSQWRRIIAASVCLLAGVVLRILEPWPLQYVIDRILIPSTTAVGTHAAPSFENSLLSTLTLCAVSMVLIALVRASADYYRTVAFSLVGNKVVTELRARVYQHVQNLSMDFHQKSRNGDMTVRLISDLNMLKEVAVSAALPLLSSLLLLVGMMGVMLWLNVQLGLVAVGILPAFWLVTARGSKKIHQSAKLQRKREGALAATAAEAMSAVKSVQAMAIGSRFATVFGESNSKSHKEGVKTSRLTAGLERSVDVLIAIASAIVVWQGARLVQQEVLSPGGLVVYLAYLKRGYKPLQDFAKYTGRISKGLAAGERIVELLDHEVTIKDSPQSTRAPNLRGDIEFKDVSFAYPGKLDVLLNLSFHLPCGKHLAIVGPSGVGKSTILSLLLRLYDPREGAICIQNQDIRTFTLQSLREQMSIVLQDNAVFASTVRDNIALSMTSATDKEILAAANIAMADGFIRELPVGFDTRLGERGVDLSQGQRQRLAIARAALRQSPILLLDEPTSNLDASNRAHVSAALRRVAANRTTILVTHDMDLAAQSDLVLCLVGDGQYEYGTPQQLAALGGVYCSLTSLQDSAKTGGSNVVNS